ncbi:MAG: hypothetical protein JOY71_04685 [Acetobacteraceae bacterium]|nr:hypothetical protein [Acetobacteraceae bacterium]MBV8589126.1 hypothetical protein [Acetobacteraceae bacterium]
MVKKLKSVATAQAEPQAAPSPAPSRLQSAQLRQIAEQIAPTQPPAVMPTRRRSTLINMRVETALADWLADQAEAESTTQKVIITRALAAAGAPVSPQDLEDRTPRRRRS